MAEKTISITFDGYWRDEKKESIPKESGVYCVYECTHNVQEKTVTIHKLIYVGESDNVNDRIVNHEKYEDWLKHVQRGNELCFSFGGVVSTDRARAEAAIIFKHKPPENDEYVDSFPFDKTTMSLSGQTALLDSSFVVNRT
jgi:excinuclease UvrABC nuclease subunit